MKKSIKKIFSKLTPWGVDEEFFSNKIENSKAGKFILSFQGKIIGILEYENDKWIFKYSEEFKQNQFVSPIIDFPDINKTYEFDELMPFFATRIPNLNQPFHKKKLKKYKGNKNDLVSLLQIFGERSINNPFNLKLV
jgi:HipA-like protein